MLTVQFAGSGDAFGTVGRFQVCISPCWQQSHLIEDVGASSLIALKRLGVTSAYDRMRQATRPLAERGYQITAVDLVHVLLGDAAGQKESRSGW